MARHRVENQIQTSEVLLQGFRISGADEVIGSLLLAQLLFGWVCRNGRNLVAHCFGKFNSHGAESTDSNDSNSEFLLSVCIPISEWVVKCNACAQDWSHSLVRNSLWNSKNEPLMDHMTG